MYLKHNVDIRSAQVDVLVITYIVRTDHTPKNKKNHARKKNRVRKKKHLQEKPHTCSFLTPEATENLLLVPRVFNCLEKHFKRAR